MGSELADMVSRYILYSLTHWTSHHSVPPLCLRKQHSRAEARGQSWPGTVGARDHGTGQGKPGFKVRECATINFLSLNFHFEKMLNFWAS